MIKIELKMISFYLTSRELVRLLHGASEFKVEPQKAGGIVCQEKSSETLDIERFWTRPSIERWKKEYTLALYAKTVRVQEDRNCMEEPKLDDPAIRVETKAQKESRAPRNKAAKDAAKQRYETSYKRWKETSSSGLNLTAANYRAKAILYMMMGPGGQRSLKNKLSHVNIEEDSVDFGDLWHYLDVAFYKKRNIIVARVALFFRRQEDGESLEQFHGVLQALAAKCKLRDMEEELVRDLFITNMNDLELQKFFVEEMDA